jgi:hypothetical protein
MIGLPNEQTLAIACERRIGYEVRAASTFELRCVSARGVRTKPRRREQIVIALTDHDLWFLEYRYRVVGFTIGSVLTHWPRCAVIAAWRHRRWAWPSVWRLELSWPGRAFYIEGDLMSGQDADALIGLMACDDFDRSPTSPAASVG